MSADKWQSIIAQMKEQGIHFEAGLTDAEIATTENHFGFRFPPDLRAFLQTALPMGDRFSNWRENEEEVLEEWLALPLDGILFDIEFNDFWLDEWMPRP